MSRRSAMKRHAIPVLVVLVSLLGIKASAQNDNKKNEISDCTTIAQPGSYVVTNNITATSSNVIAIPGLNPACIVITADFVTLDLDGFAITGSNLSTSLIHGVSTDFVNHFGIYVHSGTVTNFSGFGVALFGNGHTVEHIRAVKNLDGIIVHGLGASPNGSRIVGNIAIANSSIGINVGCPSVVLENAAAGNGTDINLFSGVGCNLQENVPTP
jgi:hypothetical protein